ncbi:hypothetical protein PsorP6_017979 [Peronosclerospora sorghi]|uniref:Uncharacterized protein n=1 Tax=Peronosclerospora sorghi TaxID=230839 RepID=A0ACC0WEH0_9STRA|nr:hypothetical protein PsorP6_017979 [Peronosclerospora sorghi]
MNDAFAKSLVQNLDVMSKIKDVTIILDGLQYCLELNEGKWVDKPYHPADIREIICNRYHFVNNEALVAILKPVVDAIGRLENRILPLWLIS